MNESTTHLKDTTANPAPLGLLGFGMTTVLLNLHNAGFYELNSMILAMGICYGGAAQIVAGIMEWRKGNTFATTAFLVLRLVLVLARRVDYFAEARMGHGLQRHCDGGLSFHVGSVHRSDVYWHVALACRRAGRFRFADDSFLSPGDWRFH